MTDHDRWTPSAADPLLMLAMDHRASFAKLFGIGDDPSPDELRRLEDLKGLIYSGLLRARNRVDRGRVAVLVDERYGGGVVSRAEGDDVVLAVPIEASGHDWFVLEWGDRWREHVEETHPDFAKVLVRDNPDVDAGDRGGQFARLREVVDGLVGLGRPLILELLVPATPGQLASVGGDADRYDAELRAGLTARSIRDFAAHGIVPRLWKIEGLESTADATTVLDAVREHGSDAIVLGRDAPHERLVRWLEVAAPLPGFVGFAIGRSIWEDLVRSLPAHPDAAARERAVAGIADRYADYASTWLRAGGGSAR